MPPMHTRTTGQPDARGTEFPEPRAARRMKARALAGLLACLLSSGLVRAADPPKRPQPDYDGRGGRPETPARRALWVPRILLSPAYFVSEFLIRRPLGITITA